MCLPVGKAIELLAKLITLSNSDFGKMIMPPQISFGWSCAWYVSDVATPNPLPAPRAAQKRSVFWVEDAVTMDPFARTYSTASILSTTKPCSPVRNP